MLLSGLVYPGLGQLVLGRVAAGVIFILLTTIGFIIFIYCIIQRAAHAVDQILPMLANDELDFSILIDRLSQDSASGWQVESVTLTGIACCWLLAIGHAYFSGKKIDQQPR